MTLLPPQAFVLSAAPKPTGTGLRLTGRPWLAEQAWLFLVFVPLLLLPTRFLRAHAGLLWSLGAIALAWLLVTAARIAIDVDPGAGVLRVRRTWLGFALGAEELALPAGAALSLDHVPRTGLRKSVPPVILRLEAAGGARVLGRLYWDEAQLNGLRQAFRNVRGVRFVPPRAPGTSDS